ncbi:MAG: gamma-glutamyl-gamma-aminobutyrate hydrolase family protein [Anaerolineae bacterium]
MTQAHRPLIGIPAATYTDQEYVATPTHRLNGNYPAALAACGALPVVIPLNLPDAILHDLFLRLDGLCLPGGVDVDPVHYGEPHHAALGQVDAARDDTELKLARWALDADLPILGICRGIQLLNVAAGGSLYQDIPAQLPEAGRHNYRLAEIAWDRPTHRVHMAEGSLLARVLGAREVMTNSYHHQAVKRVADGFRPVAWADDGVVEGIEHPGRRFVLAVQWHPEGMFRSDPFARRIFEAFVAAACG